MNREFLTENRLGNTDYDVQKEIRERIAKKWEETTLLEGLEGNVKENMALLFENQAKELLREATTAASSGSFETVVFPIIRRVFARLLANDIVSVQAMNLPSGLLFYMEPKISEREWKEDDQTHVVTGEHNGLMGYNRKDRKKAGAADVPRFYLPDEALEGAKPTVTKFQEKALYDLFYNDFLYDHSRGKITIKTGTAEVVGWNDKGALVTKAEGAKIAKYSDGSYRNVILKISGFEEVGKGRLVGPDGNEMDSETFLASLKVIAKKGGIGTGSDFATFAENEQLLFRVVTQKYGKSLVAYDSICDSKGDIFVDVDLAKPVSKQGATIDGFIGVEAEPTAADFMVAWCQYDSLELETEMGEVTFDLQKVAVTVSPRKLRATWSPEMAQDVNAYHNIDAEAELTALLSETIAAETDREILRDLRVVGPWTLHWDYNGWVRRAGFSTNYTQKDWNQMLMTAINQISAQIQKATLQGSANFIVVSTEVSAVLNDLEYFHVTDASAEQNQYAMGIEKIGALMNRYQVYVDPYAPAGKVIVGHKGKTLLDTGYIYAPYIPMQLTPVIINPENFAPVRGIMTRYAKKCVNKRFYGRVDVSGLVTFNPMELR